jgi:hypothetical protein
MFLKVSKNDKWQCIAKTVKRNNLTFDSNLDKISQQPENCENRNEMVG